MKLRLLTAAVVLPLLGFSQLGVSTLGETYQVTFDATLSGVNNGVFVANGFSSAPSTGQLDSDAWRYSGATSPASVAFGGTANTGEATNGTSTGANGGLASNDPGFYGFNTNNSGILAADYCLGWFSDGVTLDPGEIVLRIQNNTGVTVNVIRLAYEAKSYNNRPDGTDIDVAYSLDDVSYTTVGALGYTSPIAGSGSASWESSSEAAVITGLTWTSGSYLYVKWTTAYATNGGGFADPVGIDDISIRAYDADYVYDGSSWSPSAPSGTLTSDNALVLPGGVATIAGSTTLNDLFVESGAALDVTTDLTLASKIYLYSDGNGYAQVKGAVTGTAVWQSHLTTSSGRWFNSAIPVDATWDDVTGMDVQTTGATTTTNLWYYDASTGSGTDGTWEHVLDKTTAQTEYIGYQIYGGDGKFFGSGPFTIEVEGALIEAPVSVSVSGDAAGRFNLVPNPYSSSIDWDLVEASNSELGSIYYIQDGEPDLGAVQFRSYTSGGSGTNGATDDLPPGQAFFVSVDNSTDGTIDITESHRNVTGTATIYKTTAIAGLVKFNVAHSTLGYSDENEIRFDANYDDNYSFREDGAKRMNTIYPNIYTKSADNMDVVFNGMDAAFTTKAVNLYFQGDEAGTYDINMVYDGLPAEWTVTLEDKFTGTFTDLRKSAYSFNHATGANDDRFVVHFNTVGAVGVDEFAYAKVFSFVSENMLNVDLGDVKNADISVLDITGKEIARVSGVEGVTSFDMSDWAQGVYVVNVTTEGKQVHQNKVVH